MTENFVALQYLDSIIYLSITVIVLYFFVGKNVSVFLLFTWFIVHILTHKNMALLIYNSLESILKNESRDVSSSMYITIAQFVLLGAIVVKSVSAFIYMFSRSRISLKQRIDGKAYEPPKRHRFYETEYKKLYIVSLVCIALLAFIFTHSNAGLINFSLSGIGINIPTLIIALTTGLSAYLSTLFNNVTNFDKIIGSVYVESILLSLLFIAFTIIPVIDPRLFGYVLITLITGLTGVTSIYELLNSLKYSPLQHMY